MADIIDKEEFDAAEEEANEDEASVCVHKFNKPVEYNGKAISVLRFDFDSLTGKDAMDIEDEVTRQCGKTVITPALSSEFIIRMCAKACDQKIGSDIFSFMSLRDFNQIKARARNFLMRSEQ